MSKLKWCIKRTGENYKEVNEWANKFKAGSDGYTKKYGYIHSEKIEPYTLYSTSKYPDFHEITIDEFRLLTDPEKFNCYCVDTGLSCGTKEYFIKLKIASCLEKRIKSFSEVSFPVFQELQRMWKEREGQKELYNEVMQKQCDTPNESEADFEFRQKQYFCRHEVEFITDWREQTKLGIKAMNKVIKALDKQNKLLRKLIKKQNPKRHEKTIM